jgi:phospholipid/cholesterol/gamma-HCH transport system substrate-binding protein
VSAPRRRRARALSARWGRWPAAVALAGLLAGCSSGFNGIYSLPLPGGASLGAHPYQVTARFANAENLVPQAAVQVNNVAVGRVTRIYLPPGSWTASVTMVVNGDVRLPANAIAAVQQSSLLGEQYIALSAPPGVPAAGRLHGGMVIPVSRTTSNATVEDVLGALSLVLNGGGISQLHTITTQLNAALAGHELQIRALFAQITTLVSNLNSHRQDILNALDGLDSLSVTLAARNRQIGAVLDNLSPGLRVLHRLSGVAVTTIRASQASLVSDLSQLAPTLRQLANAGQNLPLALQVLLTYPFTNQVLSDIKGDYLNAYLSLRAAPGTTVIPPVHPSHAKGQG